MAHAVSAFNQPQPKTVYILRLQGANYYVGATDNLERRMRQHTSGRGAAWTKRHSPIKTVASSDPVSHWKQLEREVTIQVMATYGWAKVRGGPWTKREMETPPTPLAMRKKEVSD